VAQILGGISAAAVIEALLPGDLVVGTGLGGGCTTVQGLFLEMFLTAQLVITIFMLANEKTKATFLAPLGIGMSLFIAHLAGVYYTGASMNPARSFGPSVVTHHFDNYHWIYWVGPFLGAILATGFYKLLKVLEYETANPDQDIDLTCSHREDTSRFSCTADLSAPIERKELSQTRINTQSSGLSRSKDSDLESAPPLQSKVLVRQATGSSQSEDHIRPITT